MFESIFNGDSWSSKDVTLIGTTVAAGFGIFWRLIVIPIWKKTIIPILRFLSSHEELMSSVDTIKKEVLPNGGNSLKDTVTSLNSTCKRIEETQKVIEQRSRLALYYQNKPLFETDKDGHLLWSNEEFYNLACDNQEDLHGFNWINYVQSSDRDDFIKEFKSCSDMCRKFEFETFSSDGKKIKFVGTPYKINESSHMGFIFNLSIIGD